MSAKNARAGTKIRTGIGPFSSVDRLLSVDRRTRLGKFMHETRKNLLAHVGPEPSVPEQIIIHQIVIKLTRLVMLEKHMLSEKGLEEDGDRHQWAAWSNSLRRDLEALGISGKRAEVPDLRSYITGAAAE